MIDYPQNAGQKICSSISLPRAAAPYPSLQYLSNPFSTSASDILEVQPMILYFCHHPALVSCASYIYSLYISRTPDLYDAKPIIPYRGWFTQMIERIMPIARNTVNRLKMAFYKRRDGGLEDESDGYVVPGLMWLLLSEAVVRCLTCLRC